MTFTKSLLLIAIAIFSGVSCGKEERKKPVAQPPVEQPQPDPPPDEEKPTRPCPLPIPEPLPCPTIPPGMPIPPIPGNPLPPEPKPEPHPEPPQDEPAIVRALLDEVNKARQSRGLSLVAFDPALDCAAQKHADDIGPRRVCSHTGSDGSSPWQRASNCGTVANGEIVACGQGTPKAAVDAWTLSPGHAAIMYDAAQKAMGGGWNGNYWVVIWRK